MTNSNAAPGSEAGSEAGAGAIDALLDRVLADQRLVGAVVLILRDSQPFYSRAVGLADREARTPMAPDTIFRLASMTKPIVSVATLALAEAGRLDLDDPVTAFLPGFRLAGPDGREAVITIRHLLTHTAGLSYGFLQEGEGVYRQAGISDGIDRPGISLDENLRRIATVPLRFAPGSAWHYSLATDVLGAVLSAASGETLPEIVADRVTRPLGMTVSAFVATKPDRLATPYADAPSPGLEPVRMTDPFVLPQAEGGPVHFSPGRAMDASAYASGGAGMVGTAADYMRFLEAVRLGGAPVLSSAGAAAFVADAVPGMEIDLSGPGWGFGLGVGHLRDPIAAETPAKAGSWAWGGVYGTSFWVDPASRLSAVALTNTALEGTNGDFTRDIIKAAYAELSAS
jgi:CubicO group peptidase (beta-lactamase class C family)